MTILHFFFNIFTRFCEIVSIDFTVAILFQQCSVMTINISKLCRCFFHFVSLLLVLLEHIIPNNFSSFFRFFYFFSYFFFIFLFLLPSCISSVYSSFQSFFLFVFLFLFQVIKFLIIRVQLHKNMIQYKSVRCNL